MDSILHSSPKDPPQPADTLAVHPSSETAVDDCPSQQSAMTDEKTPAAHEASDEQDERYLVRNPRQIRQLLQAMIDQRSLINAHLAGREQSFPTAILELDDDEVLIDGSPSESANAAAEAAPHLLCFAQLERVTVRFRLDGLVRVRNGVHTAFRADVPEEMVHLQRRELYRLETPVTDSPTCHVPRGENGEGASFRVLDISGGGISLALPADQHVFSMQQRYPGCQLALPDAPPMTVTLVACNVRTQVMPNGVEIQRVGLRFDDMPRGGDAAIQRYIFRIERQRSARKNGDL